MRGEGQARYVIDAKTGKGTTVERGVPATKSKEVIPREKNIAKKYIEARDMQETGAKADAFVSKMNPDQTLALRSYMDGLDATDSSHAAMVAAVREGKKALAAGEMNTKGLDATLDWKDAMNKLRALESDAKSSGINIAAYDLGRRKSRDALRTQLVGSRSLGREETSVKTEALKNAETVGYAEPRPLARVNRGPDWRVIRNTVVDMRPVDQRPEDGPAKVVPAPQPKSAWGRAKSWMSGTPVGKAARWLGVGIIGVLGMSVLGPRQDVEDRPQAEQSAMMAPVQEVLPAANVSVDDENLLINAAEDVEEMSGDSAATKETKAAVREFRKSGDPRNLEDALKILEPFDGKDAYLRRRAEASKADLQARLADLAFIRSAINSRSSTVEMSKRLDVKKKIEDLKSRIDLMKAIKDI